MNTLFIIDPNDGPFYCCSIFFELYIQILKANFNSQLSKPIKKNKKILQILIFEIKVILKIYLSVVNKIYYNKLALKRTLGDWNSCSLEPEFVITSGFSMFSGGRQISSLYNASFRTTRVAKINLLATFFYQKDYLCAWL